MKLRENSWTWDRWPRRHLRGSREVSIGFLLGEVLDEGWDWVGMKKKGLVGM